MGNRTGDDGEDRYEPAKLANGQGEAQGTKGRDKNWERKKWARIWAVLGTIRRCDWCFSSPNPKGKPPTGNRQPPDADQA